MRAAAAVPYSSSTWNRKPRSYTHTHIHTRTHTYTLAYPDWYRTNSVLDQMVKNKHLQGFFARGIIVSWIPRPPILHNPLPEPRWVMGTHHRASKTQFRAIRIGQASKEKD
jgi:hypothetical protein